MKVSTGDKIFIDGECTISEFEMIFRSYYRPLFLYAYGFVMDEMEADDIVQETFSLIWERRSKLPEQLDVRAYLYTAVKHACLRYFRRLKLTDEYRKKQVEALLLSCVDDVDDVDDADEIIQSVKTAMNALTEQQNLIVKMHINEGLTYIEIAEKLGLTDNTVRTHIKRAYKVLRTHLRCFFPGIYIFILVPF